MKVLFAVSNEKIVQSVVKTYQKTYKDVLSYKTVYYFNALLKELQKDKSFDRIVISEDLEQFTNKSYDEMDKFIFERLDSITDEAENDRGEDIPIILICADRRAKSDSILGKIFGIGIYSALYGENRSIDEVSNLINKPRGKKEAKTYYKIEADEVKYEAEDENNVSEAEIQNIITHYKKLGKDEEKYINSFDNIASQYNEQQLKIIIKFLPLNVKAVLEQSSGKYKEIMGFKGRTNYNNYNSNDRTRVTTPIASKSSTGIDVLDGVSNKNKLGKPIIIPGVTNVAKPEKTIVRQEKPVEPIKKEQVDITLDEEDEEIVEPIVEKNVLEEIPIKEKKGRGRPKKVQPIPIEKQEPIEEKINKVPDLDEEEQEVNLFDLDEEEPVKSVEKEIDFAEELPQPEEIEEFEIRPQISKEEPKKEVPSLDFDEPQANVTKTIEETPFTLGDTVLNNILAKNKKMVSFIGTSKNGTSFIINNLAILFSSMGIKTAILDMTTNKNSYYIYTKNQENLRQIAYESIENLRHGENKGVVVNKYLSVFTALPTQKDIVYDHEKIIDTLVSNYSLILIDCDFNTPLEYFSAAQEIYLVQSMDILTIQPLTAFLRELKTRKILQDNIKIIVNKYLNCRGLTAKSIVGGLAFYNDPAMTFMTELFDRNKITHFTIPFEEQNCIKYIEDLVECNITIKGYTKKFKTSLEELADSVYPLMTDNLSGKNKNNEVKGSNFSTNVNSTLEQMKKNY